jgi:hypothetical protein
MVQGSDDPILGLTLMVSGADRSTLPRLKFVKGL